jgi:hypothetical protein
MNKIDKFRGILEVPIGNEMLLLNSLKVNDLFNLLLLNKQKENQLTYGINLILNIISKSYPEEDIGEIEQFVISNYVELIEEIMIVLGWTTREKLIELKQPKKEITKEQSIELFKARLSQEADLEDVEDKYITTSYILMREFKYTKEYILSMDATTFLILIEEMNKQNEREKEEMNKNKTLGKR